MSDKSKSDAQSGKSTKKP